MLKISVVIPLYNGSLLIIRCLDSVFSQIGNYELEVIVIDDGSTDNSVELMSKYPHPIHLIQQANNGPAAARNKGIEAATGKYLAFLDADDYWEPTFLKETVSFLEIQKKAVAVSVGQKHITVSNHNAIVPRFLETQSSNIEQSIILDDFYAFWAEHFHVCTGSILMRTEIVKHTGGQRTDLRITEDLEFWAYLATYGQFGFIPKVLFVSDGILLTKKIGWIKKNKKRWASAPSVEKWEERIFPALTKTNIKPYKIVRGRIAKNLCYSMIMSSRSQLALKTVLKYGYSFPRDRVGKLLQIGSKNSLSWLIVVMLIRIRELTRIVN